MKLTPFQHFAQQQGVFVQGKKDEQIAVLLSRQLSRLGAATYAVAPRQSGKRMDIVVEIQGRWMHTEALAECSEAGIAAAYEIARENHRRIFTLTQEAV